MDPVTGLQRGGTESKMKEMRRGCISTERSMVTLILLHIVIITLLNMTQAGWHISSFQSNLLLGKEQLRSAPESRGGAVKVVLV